MNFPRPFAGVDAATRRLRLVLLAATLLGMLSCLPLWLTARAYPLAPLVAGFPNLPPPLDKLLLAVSLLTLIGAAWFYRACVSSFLAATLFLYFGDQNRGQPWMYLYWVLLLLSLWPHARGWAAMRIAISVSYLWAGVQKLNATYFKAIPAWFVQPVERWGAPDWVVELMRLGVAAAPFVEIAIGIGVWMSVTRRGALMAVVAVHSISLLLLGPLGHNVNLVVWPWNLAMMALMLVLFSETSKQVSFTAAWAALRPARGARGILMLIGALPVLSYWGSWNSYFSFSLYSANTARADIYVSEAFRNRLSPELRRFVEPVKDFDPTFQKPFTFAHLKWAVAELGVPGVPEPTAFSEVFRAVSQAARDENDCHMIIETRDGRAWLFLPGEHSPKAIGQ